MPITGWLVHKYRSRNVSVGASCLLVVLLPLLAMAQNGTSLGIILFFFGVSLGATNVAINAQSVIVEKRIGLPLMSGFHCFFSVGGLVGALFMSVLLKSGLQLHSSASIVSGVIALILFFQGRHLLDEDDEGLKSSTKSSFTMPGSRVFFLGILCFILFLAEGAMLDWGAVFLIVNDNYDEAIAGIGYASFSIAMAIGRWAGDKLTQKWGAVKMIQFGGFIAATGLFIALGVHWKYVELVGFFLVGIGASNIVPLLFSAAGRIPGTSSSLGLTVVTTFGYVGILLGPALIGFVAEATSLLFAFGCVAAMLLFVSITGRSVR